jgi:hypothetical protein
MERGNIILFFRQVKFKKKSGNVINLVMGASKLNYPNPIFFYQYIEKPAIKQNWGF